MKKTRSRKSRDTVPLIRSSWLSMLLWEGSWCSASFLLNKRVFMSFRVSEKDEQMGAGRGRDPESARVGSFCRAYWKTRRFTKRWRFVPSSQAGSKP
jgi:hypothetical protein